MHRVVDHLFAFIGAVTVQVFLALEHGQRLIVCSTEFLFEIGPEVDVALGLLLLIEDILDQIISMFSHTEVLVREVAAFRLVV